MVKDTQLLYKVYLSFVATLTSHADYMLYASGIRDTTGNMNPEDSINFSHIIPQAYDMLIHEIMADEAPVRQIPYEYIELYNASGNALDLAGWTLDDGGKPALFPSQVLLPDSFIVICATATAGEALAEYGRTMVLPGFPSLNNDGDTLTLCSPSGIRIHRVAYRDSWYRNTVKKEGGWSLEMINPAYPCLGADNWMASADSRGGTPGTRNSVKGEVSDTKPPQILSSYPTDKYTVEVGFSETLDSTWTEKHIYIVRQPGNMIPAIEITGPMFDRIRLRFTDSTETGIIYRLYIDSITDCRGQFTNRCNHGFWLA